MMKEYRPVRRFRPGNVTAAVGRTDNGYSVTLQKSYKEDDEWKNTISVVSWRHLECHEGSRKSGKIYTQQDKSEGRAIGSALILIG